METKFEDISIIELYDIKPSPKHPTSNELHFSLSASPPKGWAHRPPKGWGTTQLDVLLLKFPITIQGNILIILFPFYEHFEQQELNELKYMVKTFNEYYQHSLEQQETIAEIVKPQTVKQQAQTEEEWRELIKSKIKSLDF